MNSINDVVTGANFIPELIHVIRFMQIYGKVCKERYCHDGRCSRGCEHFVGNTQEFICGLDVTTSTLQKLTHKIVDKEQGSNYDNT